MDGHSFENLEAHILSLSVSEDFNVARSEWDLIGIEVSEEFDYCPCGQKIKEHCYIRNRVTGGSTYVGNVCIKRFMSIQTGSLFDGLKRILKDDRANANHDLIEFAYRMGYLFGEKEYTFLKQTARKRKLSSAQISWKQKINRRIISKIVVQRRSRR
jgi:hypothetical protein